MKVPKPRKVSSGNWYINLRLGGESISVTEPTEKQCIKTAQLIKAEYLAGRRESKKQQEVITLTKAIDLYISSRENILSPSTIRGYRTIQENYFENLMELLITEITQDLAQRAINDEIKKHSTKGITNAWHFVASVLKNTGSISLSVRLPQVVKTDRPFLEPDQIEPFLRAVHGSDVEIPALLALCSLRRSEILALTWDDIDLKSHLIHVRGSAVLNADNTLVYKDTNKNSASRRDVPMIPQLYNALSKADKTGEHVVNLQLNSIYKRVNTICRNNKLPEVGVHGLRHSFASLCWKLNMPAKLAQEIGGWENEDVMQSVYTHIAQKDRLIAQNAMMTFYNDFANQKEN